MEFVGADADAIGELVEGASLAKKGLLPCGGGVLDQTAAFAEGMQLVWATTAEILDRAKRGRTP